MNEMDIETGTLFSMAALESQPHTFRKEKQERLKFKEKPLILPYSYQFIHFPAELIGVSHGNGSLHLPPLDPQTCPSIQRTEQTQHRGDTWWQHNQNICASLSQTPGWHQWGCGFFPNKSRARWHSDGVCSQHNVLLPALCLGDLGVWQGRAPQQHLQKISNTAVIICSVAAGELREWIYPPP